MDFSHITDAVPDFISFVDTEMRYRFVNAAYERQFSRTREELVGMRVRDVLKKAAYSSAEQGISLALKGKENRYVNVLVNPDGLTRHLEVTCIPKRTNGIIEGVIVLGHDITLQKQSVTESAERVRQFKFMADLMPQLVWTSNPDGVPDYYNDRWFDYTGFKSDELATAGWKTVLYPDDAEPTRKIWEASLRTGEKYETELRLRRSDGEYRWFIGRAEPLKNSAGEIEKWFGTCTDITDQRRRNEQLEFLSEASKLLGSSLEYDKTLTNLTYLAVPNTADWCGIDLKDEDGSIRSVSVAHVDPKRLVVAKKLREHFPVDMNAQTGAPAVIRTGVSEFLPIVTDQMIEASILDPKQLELVRAVGFTSLMIVPLKSRGAVLGALTLVSAESKRIFTQQDLEFAEELASRAGVAVDNARLFNATETAAAEVRILNAKLEQRVEERTQQLAETNRELERSNSELQEFAYVASHDLQEPLRKITAFSNLLTEGTEQLSEESRMHIEIIRKAARRMSTLINDLLNFSRVTSKAQPFEQVDLDKILVEVLDDLDVRIRQEGGTIFSETLGSIEADTLQMRLLFQNLLSNALKYHREAVPPQIAVKMGMADPGKIEIRISDNGIGFNEAYLDKIFTIFQRLHGKDVYEGTGIGLAISKKIVERHGGTITAVSTPGEGSTFIIVLPRNH